MDEDNVQMARFIKEKRGKFENGKAFYELVQSWEEDFLHYKDVVLIPKVKCTNLLNLYHCMIIILL